MKRIPLTQGKYAIVDTEDYDWLNQWKWYASKLSGIYYAVRSGGKGKSNIFMHRQILRMKKGIKMVDHINNNGLDNRRENLRIVNNSQNQMNSRFWSNNKSGYRGVCRKKNWWYAYIWINGKSIHLGIFSNIHDAARSYNQAAKKYFREYAKFNKICLQRS